MTVKEAAPVSAVGAEGGGAAAAEPYVSVIIPTYNRAKAVYRTVRSVLGQSYKNFELIVVNDASTDTTAEDLKQIHDPRFILINNEKNQGSGGARNTGIAQARGAMLAFLDHDDQWLPEKLQKQIEYMQRVAPDCAASVTDYWRLTPRGQWVERRNSKLRDPDWLMLTGTALSMGSTMLVRREVFDALGVFDRQNPNTGNRTEDWDWWLRYRRRYKLAIVPELLTFYHGTHRARHEVERNAIGYIWDKHRQAVGEEGQARLETFRAAIGWKMARVDLTEKLYVRCFLKLLGIVLRHPLDSLRYARIVLGDFFPRLGDRKPEGVAEEAEK